MEGLLSLDRAGLQGNSQVLDVGRISMYARTWLATMNHAVEFQHVGDLTTHQVDPVMAFPQEAWAVVGPHVTAADIRCAHDREKSISEYLL
jgi:hypothetical protein